MPAMGFRKKLDGVKYIQLLGEFFNFAKPLIRAHATMQNEGQQK